MARQINHARNNDRVRGAQAHRDADFEERRQTAAAKKATRRRTRPPTTPATRWARHATFGLGEVLSTIGKGRDRKYRIDFADEVRTVAAQFVELLSVTTPATLAA